MNISSSSSSSSSFYSSSSSSASSSVASNMRSVTFDNDHCLIDDRALDKPSAHPSVAFHSPTSPLTPSPQLLQPGGCKARDSLYITIDHTPFQISFNRK